MKVRMKFILNAIDFHVTLVQIWEKNKIKYNISNGLFEFVF